jgi:carbon monoxide dehydrogenase subunit G
MHFEGTQTIRAPMETVWTFLMDPRQVGPCMPGFQSVDVIDETTFKARVGVGVGLVKATFTMDMSMVDLAPPTRATVRGHGVAPASAVDLTSTMSLGEAGGATTLQWSADVTVSGTLASLGARLMQSTAQKMTAQFFRCLQDRLETGSPA